VKSFDMAALGRRVAHYRRLNRYSAEQLAAASGAGLTREIIANIETGRRKDIGINQLMAMAVTLRVPLVALLLPLDDPGQTVLTTLQHDEETEWTALQLLHQFQGWGSDAASSAAWRESSAQLSALRTYGTLLNNLDEANARERFPADYPPTDADSVRRAIRDAETALHDHMTVLRGLNVRVSDG
jgi:transcriptional regulator with XRE-family HTH domain